MMKKKMYTAICTSLLLLAPLAFADHPTGSSEFGGGSGGFSSDSASCNTDWLYESGRTDGSDTRPTERSCLYSGSPCYEGYECCSGNCKVFSDAYG
ncbi:MAG: hypothetical protein HQK50_16110, partial [Oligoflexia bacterium]|nr:hypothetical protein [Oligoflexia bacterium]